VRSDEPSSVTGIFSLKINRLRVPSSGSCSILVAGDRCHRSSLFFAAANRAPELRTEKYRTKPFSAATSGKQSTPGSFCQPAWAPAKGHLGPGPCDGSAPEALR